MGQENIENNEAMVSGLKNNCLYNRYNETCVIFQMVNIRPYIMFLTDDDGLSLVLRCVAIFVSVLRSAFDIKFRD